MKKITTLLLAGISGLLAAGDLQLNDKGYFELDGWRATPTTYSESWQALQPTSSRQVFKKIDSESGVLFQMNFAGGASGKLALALENEENATASVNMENGSLAKPLCLNTLLPVSSYEGTKFEADGKIGHFPKEFDKTVIYAGTVKQFRIPSKSGEILIEGNFYLRIQDDRKWNGSTFNIRLGFTPYTTGIQKSKITLRIRQGNSGEFGKELGSLNNTAQN